MEMAKNNVNAVNNTESVEKQNMGESYTRPLITSQTSLAEQMKGLDFETQKKLLNSMARSGIAIKKSEPSMKRYTVQDIYEMNESLQDSIKILINEAAMAPKTDIQGVNEIVNEFRKMHSDSKTNTFSPFKTMLKT